MEHSTVGEEAEMIRAYLNICKVRMGDRLTYRIQLPEKLKNRPLPPMLLQPLVENAVRHGLEPKVEGGEVSITVEEAPAGLRLVVSDTGLGFQGDNEVGIGIANVRQRLESLYGSRARLTLEEGRPSGLRAVIEVPRV
jgi:sensor histidine kinase YesM